MKPSGARILRGLILAALAATLSAGALATVARADGDPASDYLRTNQVFLGAVTSGASAAPSAPEQRLLATVAAANRAGFPIRVAVVASQYDLGGVTALWGKPQLYARFLGLELASVYRGRLLVVMPDGYGFNWPGHRVAAEARRLAAGRPLPLAAAASVRALATASGVKLPATPAPTPGGRSAKPGTSSPSRHSSSGLSWLVILAAALLLVLVVGALLAGPGVLRRGAGRRLGTARQGRPRLARPRLAPLRALQGFAALGLLGLTVPIVVLLATRQSKAGPGASTAGLITPPPFQWPAGTRAAPAFSLLDQSGQPVSPRRFRGRPVIVTFVDPLCRNLCPLEAHVLNAAVGRMPAAERPTILAVSVNVSADRRANLLQDVHRWSLVPEWHWAVGRASALARVWGQYKVGVSVIRRRVGGVRLTYIAHSEVAYVLDSSGHERALFVWPFYPQDVAHLLRRLA